MMAPAVGTSQSSLPHSSSGRMALSVTASLSYLPPAFQNVEDRLGKHDVAVFTKLSGLVIIPAGASVFRFTALEDIAHTVKQRAIERDANALDSTTIDLCLSLFPWATFRKRKAAIKLHTLLTLQGNFPTVIIVSTGSVHDVNPLDQLVWEATAIIASRNRQVMQRARKLF